MTLRYLASYSLPTFGSDQRAAHIIAPQSFAAGDARRPVLVFFSGYFALANPAPVELGRALDGEFDLHGLAHPGFGARRDIPDSVATLVDLHAETVKDLVGDRPFVLVGNSTGGGVAHAVAERLVAAGGPPAGLILIESDHSDEGREDKRALCLVEADRDRPEELFNGFFSDQVTIAGGAYVRLFEDWRPEPIPVPTLLLRAAPTREMLDADPDGNWEPRWPLPHEAVDIPGDHYSVLGADTETTAAAMRTWLRALPAV
jgi:thioesterase domain-containing protein